MIKLLSQIFFILRSLRFRLGIVIFSLAVIPAVIVLSIYSRNYESREISSLTMSLTSQAQLISSQIVTGGYLQDTSGSLSTRLNSLKEMFVGRIMIMDSSMNILIDTYDIYDGKVMVWENAIRSSMGETLSSYDRDNSILSVSIPIGSTKDLEAGKISGVVLISRNTDQITQDLEFFNNFALTIIIIVVLLAAVISFLTSYFLIRPVEKLYEGVSGLLDETIVKLEGSNASEINKISDAINNYSDKQRNLDNSMRDFISNVSHELKTPLTSMKIMADSLNSGDAPLEFYKEFMVDIASEIDRETAIINELLHLVKTESYASTLNRVPVNVNEIMEKVLKTLIPIAEKAEVEIVLETFRPITMELDKVKFSQAMINLIENAIKYNRAGGYVHVSVNSDSTYCFIRVEDNGIGIPKENLDQIFERFYRVDTSHSKEIEGTGLGLSIVKNIVMLHGGQIKADSIEGQGTTFTVRLPLVYGG